MTPTAGMLPYDSLSLVAISVAALCLAGASTVRAPVPIRLALILVAAFVIRLDPAWQDSMHAWDERVHALVARRMMEHPLVPMLYERPVLPPAPGEWTYASVWLHKPPLAMWFMAASMSLFGAGPVAMRLPSLVWSTAGVLLTYLTGRRVFGERVGLLAAAFQAVNGLLVGLASGRRVADHVDTALIFWVQLGVFLAVVAASPGRDRAWRPIASGLAMGAGWLTKSLPALVVVGVAAVGELSRRQWWHAWRRLALLAAAAVALVAPWTVYARARFPAEAAQAWSYALRHITSVVEGHGGPAWAYVADMPHFFGELVYLPVAWFLVRAWRRRAAPAERAIAAWLAAPYAVFSVMATKLPAFVAIAAPALFIAQAAFWCHLRDRHRTATGRSARLALGVLLALLVMLPARYLLEPTGPFERRDRTSAATRQLRSLDREIGTTDAVVFNMPRALEAMFYSDVTVYDRMPTPTEVAELQRRGTTIVVFQPTGEEVSVPDGWGARILTEATR